MIKKINEDTLDDPMPYNIFCDLLHKNRLLSAIKKKKHMAHEVRSQKAVVGNECAPQWSINNLTAHE